MKAFRHDEEMRGLIPIARHPGDAARGDATPVARGLL